MTDSNNVVLFPNSRVGMPPLTLEEIRTNQNTVKIVHINETVDGLLPLIFGHLMVVGFDFSDRGDIYAKDTALMVESIRSLLAKFHGLKHPLQETAELFFEPLEEEIVVKVKDAADEANDNGMG